VTQTDTKTEGGLIRYEPIDRRPGKHEIVSAAACVPLAWLERVLIEHTIWDEAAYVVRIMLHNDAVRGALPGLL
jgi:hypothetical protein